MFSIELHCGNIPSVVYILDILFDLNLEWAKSSILSYTFFKSFVSIIP